MIKNQMCQHVSHENNPIQGFCLNQDCQCKPEWCTQCLTTKHQQHKDDCKTYVQTYQMIKNYFNILSEWIKNVNDEFQILQNQFLSVTMFLENEKNKMVELENQLNENDNSQLLVDIPYLKSWENISQTSINNKDIINMLTQFNELDNQINNHIKGNKNGSYASGMFHLGNKEYDQAFQCFEDVIKDNPQNSLAWCQKGRVLMYLGKFKEAIECEDYAINIDAQLAIAHGIKGGCLSGLERYDEGMKCCMQALSIDNKCAIALINKGYTLYKLNKLQDAIKCYDQAINLDPNNPITYYNKGQQQNINLASVLRSLEKYESAIKCYDQALCLDPKYALAYKNKGMCLQAMKKSQEAQKCFEKAKNLK